MQALYVRVSGKERHTSKNLEIVQFPFINRKKFLENDHKQRSGHVGLNDKNMSGTNDYGKSNSVHPSPKETRRENKES